MEREDFKAEDHEESVPSSIVLYSLNSLYRTMLLGTQYADHGASNPSAFDQE